MKSPLEMCLIAVLLPCLAAGGVLLFAQAEEPLPKVDAAEVDGPQPLMLTLSAAGHTDRSIVRVPALFVPAGQSASSMLPAGPFKAQWTGDIHIGLRGRYIFSLQGAGKAKVTINDNLILEGDGDLSIVEPSARIRLNQGANKLIIEYESPAAGDAAFRLLWQSDEFPSELLSPMALRHDPIQERGNDAASAFGNDARHGRELFATLRCIKCHTPDDELLAAKDRMPELETDAPSLAQAGVRLKQEWMAAWIADPRSLRTDATMPRMNPMPGGGGPGGSGRGQGGLGGPGGPGVLGMVPMWAADVAAYLATLGKPQPAPATTPDTIKAGGHLFASLGCIGCHTLPDHKDAKIGDDRVPLKHVSAKWQPAALRSFLLKPTSHYAWIRMPDFALTEAEADQLAAFVLSFPAANIPGRGGPGAGRGRAPDIEHGKQMFQMLGCVACHDKDAKDAGWTNQLSAPTLAQLRKADWKKGCVADDAATRGKAPDFGFQNHDREALRDFARSQIAWKSLTNDNPRAFAARQITALNCIACHKRDGVNDKWSNHEGEVASLLIKPAVADAPIVDDFDDEVPGQEKKESQVDQSRPDLTWVGEKLKPQWMEQFFAGKLDYKLRPWLTARMPAFPMRARGLAHGLAMEHGLSPVAGEEAKPDAEMVALGRQLIGRSIDGKAGFACVQCHGIGARPAENVFEAQGINFAYSQERLRRDYYMRWMLKPTRVQPGTRMPQFAAEDGTTPFADVFGGDAHKQFDAIWQYLLTGREMTPP